LRRIASRRCIALAISSGLALSLSSPASGAEPGRNWSALETAAPVAVDAAAILGIVQELSAATSPAPVAGGSVEDLEKAAGVYAALVARSQEIESSLETFLALVELGEQLEHRIEARREALEESAGEDEAKLDSLFRSDRWEKLGSSGVAVRFWLGWAQLARVERGLVGVSRDEALAGAERAFASAARALSSPDLAVRGLLGLGIARRELGDRDGAEQCFERLLAQRAVRSDPALERRARYELALVAIDALDLERAEQRIRELADSGALAPEQRRTLETRRLRALLQIARQRDGERSEGALSEATARLRALLAEGGDDADLATALVAQFAEDLVGRDLGALGALLEADRAFRTESCEAALASYAVALAGVLSERVDLGQVRLRVAWCKARTGRADEAVQELEALLESEGSEKLSGAERVDALRLLQSLAEAKLATHPGEADVARANRAARLLLEEAPGFEGEDLAHRRRARDLAGQGRVDAALTELRSIPRESRSYPAALRERIRLEARGMDERWRALEPATAGRDDSLRRAAGRLAQSLDEERSLPRDRELPGGAEQEARLAVLRARAALLADEERTAVERWIAAARQHDALPLEGRHELLSLELAVLIAAGEIPRLVALLGERDDARLRTELVVWEERLADLEGTPSATAVLPDIYLRLLAVAPESSRSALRLGRIGALRRAGRGAEAVDLARELTLAEPEWGDAWLELGRSLDAVGNSAASREVWRKVGGGARSGDRSWWEARLSLYDAELASGESKKACGWLDAGHDLAVPRELEARIEAARAHCREPSGGDS
jgi:hypothetical protein